MSIEQARKARAEQSLDKTVRLDSGETLTKRQLMHLLHMQGGQLVVRNVRDEAAEEKIRREIEKQSRGWDLPIGNPHHPKMQAHTALKEQLKEGIFKETTYVMLPSRTYYEVSKAEAEYFRQQGSTGAARQVGR